MGIYRLSSKAPMDAAETYEYGILNYGLNQAKKYIEEMETIFNILQDPTGIMA